MSDIRELDRRAVVASVDLVSRVRPDDLARPTPCAGWTLADLIAHMSAQHRGFAAAAAGDGARLDAWEVREDPDGPVAGYRRAADEVIAAFAADGALDRQFAIPEITTKMTFPAERAISFHLVDYVVHSWDVARSLGEMPQLDDEVLAGGLTVAEAVPNGPERLVPGAFFQPSLPVPPGAGTLDRILALLGRSPDWRPES